MHEVLKNSLAGLISLSDEQWAMVFRYFKPKITKRNEILLEKGRICPYMYFVTKGALRIFLVDDNGNESTRFLVFEGRFGTAFPSFTLQQPSMAAIQSVEASEVLAISYQDYQTMLREVPGCERMVRVGLERDYIDSILRIESLISMDAKERYNMLMEKNPALIQRLPGKIVADYLGISQETLSRLKSSPKSRKSAGRKAL